MVLIKPLEVGAIVEWCAGPLGTRPEWDGNTAVVVKAPMNGHPDAIMRIRWEPYPQKGAHFDVHSSNDGGRDVYQKWVRMRHVSLDLTKPICTRNGQKVWGIMQTDDPARPIEAYTVLDGKPRLMTYQSTGLFYGRIEQDYDLVNSCS